MFELSEPPRLADVQDRGDGKETRSPPPRAEETQKRLAEVQAEVMAGDTRADPGGVEYGYTDPRRETVVVAVWIADERALRYAEKRWGGQVELRPLLEPVG